jgi:hypothetical protein
MRATEDPKAVGKAVGFPVDFGEKRAAARTRLISMSYLPHLVGACARRSLLAARCAGRTDHRSSQSVRLLAHVFLYGGHVTSNHGNGFCDGNYRDAVRPLVSAFELREEGRR